MNWLNDPDLTVQEKRAILSSWASDACAVEEMPTLRQPPGAKRPVSFDKIVDALRSLDDGPGRARDAAQETALAAKRRRRKRYPAELNFVFSKLAELLGHVRRYWAPWEVSPETMAVVVFTLTLAHPCSSARRLGERQ